MQSAASGDRPSTVSEAERVGAVESAEDGWIEGYGTRVQFNGSVIVVEATNALGRGAIGTGQIKIDVRDVVRLDLSPAATLRNGTLSVTTTATTIKIAFLKRRQLGFEALHHQLTRTVTDLRSSVRSESDQTVQASDSHGRQAATPTVRPGDRDRSGPGQGTPSPAAAVMPSRRSAQWYPLNTLVEVGGFRLPGLIYAGHGLLSATNERPEPALVDPTLPVDTKRPDWTGQGLDYWPSYSTIPAATRAAYLTWLATGRRHPGVPIGLVFLFFYGLERRVVVDALSRRDPDAQAELPTVRAELLDLLELYGGNGSFRSYSRNLLKVIEFMASAGSDADSRTPPPVPEPDKKWSVSMALRCGLGAFAASSRPVPADWALTWALSHPQIWPRTPATRCAEEFAELFAHRYAARHGAGLVLDKGAKSLILDYSAATASIGSAELSADLPDVVESEEATGALREIVETCTTELDPYSRWLGRNPDGRGTLEAAALLPAPLLARHCPQAADMAVWAENALAEEASTIVDADALALQWTHDPSVRLTKKDTVALATLLGALGYGFEPDPRMGGPVPDAGPVVLFRVDEGAPAAAGPAYRSATVLVHLATAVAAADGTASTVEAAHLRSHIEANLDLTPAERRRLKAHAEMLTRTGAKLTGLQSRLNQLSGPQRRLLGDFVVAVAAADGVIEPGEVQVITKIFKLLSLNPDSAFASLNAAQPSQPAPPPATAPVTVRPATPTQSGFAIPPATAAGTPHATPAPTGAPTLVLDPAVIEAKLAETSAVAAMLSAIFAEDATPNMRSQPSGSPAPPTATGVSVPRSDDQTWPQSSTGTAAPGDLESPRPGPLRGEPAATGPMGPDGPMGPTGPDGLAESVASMGPPRAVRGLDEPHSYLLRCLLGRPSIARADFDLLAEQSGVMPDGALDVLNEAGYEVCGDPLLEGDDPLDINRDVLKEILP